MEAVWGVCMHFLGEKKKLPVLPENPPLFKKRFIKKDS